ncbi:MAG: leucine-rich repeat domain-containing protein [Clostridia bacterium]|nr:leucine-rich repeat domain-containing protein [Clostridia bacterium]
MSEQNNVNQEEKRHLTSAERQKLYQQKATERRIEEYKKRKRARITKIALIALAVLLLIGSIIAVVLLERNVWEPARIYKSANELYVAEEYLDAYEVYLSLGEYKDAAEIASTCITKNAQKLAGREDVIIGTSKSMPWFKIDENGAISFVEKKYKGAKEIIVPDVFDNVLVMAVADKGFFYAPFESIILPPSIKRIEAQGFFACSSLKSITLPDEVEFIGEKAFEDCTALESVTLSAKLKEIGAAAFRNCNELAEIAFPEGFETIGARAIASCEKLTKITFPSTLSSIGNKAFEGSDSLTTVIYNGTKDNLEVLCSGYENEFIINKVKELICQQ